MWPNSCSASWRGGRIVVGVFLGYIGHLVIRNQAYFAAAMLAIGGCAGAAVVIGLIAAIASLQSGGSGLAGAVIFGAGLAGLVAVGVLIGVFRSPPENLDGLPHRKDAMTK